MNATMKTAAIAAALLANLFVVMAADRKIEAGPKGGRILEKTSPKAEFFVEKDRTVAVIFYDEKLQPVPVSNQTVTVVAEAKSGKTKLELTPKDGRLVSETPLPEGDGYTIVVMLRAGGEAKPQNFRFKLDMHTCGGCKRAEYACTCHHG